MAASVFLICLLVSAAHAQWELYWADEFDAAEIDRTYWDHECTAWGGGNQEFQVYTDSIENSWLQDGKLYLKPTLLENNVNPQTGEPFGADFLRDGVLDLNEIYGYCTQGESSGCYREGNGQGEWTDIPPIASARLRTTQKFGFRYGRVEIRAKMPTGDWMWPALWMLPESWCYGGWPVSGEMDITETISNEDLRYEDGYPAGMQHMASTMHWGVTSAENRYYLTGNGNVDEDVDYGRNFHDYIFEWTPNGFTTYVDDTLVLQVPDPPIDQNQDWTGFFDYGRPWTSIDEDDPEQNPWRNSNDPLLVPFDTGFHFLFNVAVGGTNGFIPDGAINRGGEFPKPWPNGVSQFEGMNMFYDALDQWYWTWTKEDEGGLENSAMQVEYIRVYKRADLPEETDCPALTFP